MNRTLLYFGSFNPIHKGHIRLAEYAIEEQLCDSVVMIISPQSPFKLSAVMASELERFEMAEIACKASKYPDKIVPSGVEFLLPKPSYTVATLDYLSAQFGSEMRFSLLIGADQVERLDEWRDYEALLNYPIFVYPRNGYSISKFEDRLIILDNAPTIDISSTAIRTLIERGGGCEEALDAGVERYIRQRGLYSIASQLSKLSELLEATPESDALYTERGILHYKQQAWGAAMNDFRRALELEPNCIEAEQYMEMIQEILSFRHTDIYNP